MAVVEALEVARRVGSTATQAPHWRLLGTLGWAVAGEIGLLSVRVYAGQVSPVSPVLAARISVQCAFVIPSSQNETLRTMLRQPELSSVGIE